MKSIKYICGWCGKPCEENGTPWSLEDIPKAFKPNRFEYVNIYGDCCRYENEKYNMSYGEEIEYGN